MITAIKYSRILILLFVGSVLCKAQSLTEYSSMLEVKDQVKLTTDRSIYAVGETIQFKANYENNFPQQDKTWSTILYVEFIKPDGSPILQQKFKIKEQVAIGTLQLPEDLYTGIYFIKAYTKWMRNFSVNNYAFERITVVNTKIDYTLDISEECKDDPGTNLKNSTQNIRVETDKNTYPTRSEINISIDLTSNKTQNNASYSISVVRKGSKKPHIKSIYSVDTSDIELRFLPEIDGLTISGTARDKETNTPAHNKIIFLALLNNMPYLSASSTTIDGRFYFRVPYLKNNKDFLVLTNDGEQKFKLELDNEFCERAIKTCNKELVMSNSDKQLAYDIAVNAQLNAAYAISDTNTHIQQRDQNIQFYGTPNRVMRMGKYIDLPYIEEFIFELVPEFIVSHRKGVPNIYTSKRNTFSPFPVLVMVDNIPVPLSDFLKIRTNKINRLELIDDAYILGGINYNGLINAITVDGDLGGIELPSNAQFFGFKLFSKELPQKQFAIDNIRTPYRPNCLYWNTNLTFDNQSTSKNISFHSSDVPGSYQVIVESVQDGIREIAISEFTIE